MSTLKSDRPTASDLQHASNHVISSKDTELEALMPRPDVTAAINEPGLPTCQIIDRLLRGYADHAALGSRRYDIVTDPQTGLTTRRFAADFEAISYDVVRQRVESIANCWREHPRHAVKPGEFVVEFGHTTADYLIADIACVYAQAIAVPLQPNLPEADLLGVFADFNPVSIVTGIEYLEATARLATKQKSIRSIVVIDMDPNVGDEMAQVEAARAIIAEAGADIVVDPLQDLIAFGSKLATPSLPASSPDLERMVQLIYTSGSTGTPKGAIITEKIANACWTGLTREIGTAPVIVLAYLPLNHIGGRSAVFTPLAHGGTVYFTLKSDMSCLLDDIRTVRPTVIQFIPRIAEVIYQHFQSELLARSNGSNDNQDLIAERIKAEMRSTFLGDRLERGSVGTAPTAPEIKAFLQDCFQIAFAEGYGTTESGGVIAVGNKIVRRFITDYRLRDVPELGYYSTDKPYPRGELLIKSKILIPGYYNRPDASASIMTDDGFQMTGDIMEERGPDEIVWLDRRNNVLKLAQGEFVAISPLEALFEGSALIRQIYVYGSGYRSYLLAVVVPHLEVAASVLGHAPDDQELAELLLAELKSIGSREQLRSFEVPRQLIIERVPFSFENGLLSSVRKPLRPNLRRKYEDRLENLYEVIEQRQTDELTLLRSKDSGLSVKQRVIGAMCASIGLDPSTMSDARPYTDLGGDSLAAISFAMLLEEMFGLPIEVGTILHPNATASSLADWIESRLVGGVDANRASFANIHGADATEILADDLKIESFVDSRILSDAATELADQSAPVVLMTGSTGFLGRFMCMDWLERVAKSGGKVICINRGADDADAQARLLSIFDGPDRELSERFRALAKDHLEVLAGELTEPFLGLDAAKYQQLTQTVTRISHPAALVNHRLPYRALFEPNVGGTAALTALALTGRLKPLDYVSTVAVSNMLGTDSDEKTDVRDCHHVTLSDRYASGYGTSKWAGEVLLLDAHEKFGLPVNVFRADMIMPHSRYLGQINVSDMITRLLLSVVKTGIAPQSFYQLDAAGHRQKAHYNGLPVDFLAQAMNEIAVSTPYHYAIYNTVNSHFDDGISLDTMIDWVESAGYPVERIADHGEWIRRFEEKLRALPEAIRNRSSLNILDGFSRPHGVDSSRYPAEQFEREVNSSEALKAIPHLTEGFIHKYLVDIKALHLMQS